MVKGTSYMISSSYYTVSNIKGIHKNLENQIDLRYEEFKNFEGELYIFI